MVLVNFALDFNKLLAQAKELLDVIAAKIQNIINFSLIYSSFPKLLDGAKVSLLISLCSVILGVSLGIIVATGRLSKFWPTKAISSAYVAFIRGTPMIVQIFIIHYGLAEFGVTLPAFASGIIALSLNSGAYMGEVFRGGIQSIDPGQTQAGLSLGLTPFQVFRYIVFPQAFRRVIPSMGNEMVTLTKDSSLVNFIAIAELTYRATLIASRTYEYFTMYIGIAIVYFAITFALSQLLALLERRMGPYDSDSKPGKGLRR
ncbi:MAG: amino acid ABC transporter permease [Firmicutes bacterium]|nr:amino acid ABC transporter permease [Bacillota bacterium]